MEVLVASVAIVVPFFSFCCSRQWVFIFVSHLFRCYRAFSSREAEVGLQTDSAGVILVEQTIGFHICIRLNTEEGCEHTRRTHAEL